MSGQTPYMSAAYGYPTSFPQVKTKRFAKIKINYYYYYSVIIGIRRIQMLKQQWH